MNKPKRFAQKRTWFSNVPPASKFLKNMETIKRLLSDVGDAKRGATPFNPKKLTETSRDEFVLGPLIAGGGGVLTVVSQLGQYLDKMPAHLLNPGKNVGLALLIVGALQMFKNPIRGMIGKLNIDDFQKLMQERIVFTYGAGSQHTFDVGTFEDYLSNPSLLPQAVFDKFGKGHTYNEKLVRLTSKSAKDLEKIAIIVENVDRATMAALLAAAGVAISSGQVFRLMELSKGRDSQDTKSRITTRKELIDRANRIKKKQQ